MSYKFAPPPDGNGTKSGTCKTLSLQERDTQTKTPGATWDTITLSLPADTTLAVPADSARWERQDARILATYTPEELTLSVKLALEEKRRHLQTRLERELDVLAAATGCDDTQADQLLAYWDALNAEYTAAVTALAAVSQSVNSENPALNDRTATSTADTTTCKNRAVYELPL